MRLKHEAPAYCCPYCLEPVGYLGRGLAWLFGTQIHQCDNLNDDSELARLRSRVECAEADAVRLVGEKMDMWERAFAAERALRAARSSAFADAITIVSQECHNMSLLPKRLQKLSIVSGSIVSKIEQRIRPVTDREQE